MTYRTGLWYWIRGDSGTPGLKTLFATSETLSHLLSCPLQSLFLLAGNKVPFKYVADTSYSGSPETHWTKHRNSSSLSQLSVVTLVLKTDLLPGIMVSPTIWAETCSEMHWLLLNLANTQTRALQKSVLLLQNKLWAAGWATWPKWLGWWLCQLHSSEWVMWRAPRELRASEVLILLPIYSTITLRMLNESNTANSWRIQSVKYHRKC